MSNVNDFELQGRRLKKYLGNEKSVTIPNTVWEIASRAFDGNDTVEEIIVPSSVFTIYEHAFYDCKNLSYVVLPESVEKIQVTGNMYKSAFYKCPNLRSAGPVGSSCHVEFAWKREIPGNAIPRVEKLVLPEELENLHPNALLDFGPGEIDCKVICPGSTFSLLPPDFKMNAAVRFLCGKDSPEGEQLKLLTAFIKKAKKKCMVTLLDKKAWQAIGELMVVCKEKPEKVDEYIAHYDQERYKELIDVMQQYKETCKPAKKKTSKTKEAEPVVPSKKKGEDIREAFTEPEFVLMEDPENNEVVLMFCSNVSAVLTIPNGVTYVNEGVCFRKSALKEVRFPNSVKTIDCGCFMECENLEKVSIPSTETKILEQTFLDCPNLTIHAPAGSYAETYAKENNIPFVAE